MNGNNITRWLEEVNDRNTFVREFNMLTKKMFSEGDTDVLYQSSVSGGTFGPRILKIKVLSGGGLTQKDLKNLDIVTDFLNDIQVARTLITLGFSYVDIYDSSGSSAIRGELLKLAGMSTSVRPENKEQKGDNNQTSSDGCVIILTIIFFVFLLLVMITKSL